MTAAIILIILGILVTSNGIATAITLIIKCWWLLCQICFHEKLQKISYEISFALRWQIALTITTGPVLIVVGFRLLP